MPWVKRSWYWFSAAWYAAFFAVGMFLGWCGKTLSFVSGEVVLKVLSVLATAAVALAGIWIGWVANDISNKQASLMRLEFEPIWEVVESIAPYNSEYGLGYHVVVSNYGSPVVLKGFDVLTYGVARVRTGGEVYQYVNIMVPLTEFYIDPRLSPANNGQVLRFIGPQLEQLNSDFVGDIFAATQDERDDDVLVRLDYRGTLVTIHYQDRMGNTLVKYFWSRGTIFSEVDRSLGQEIIWCVTESRFMDTAISVWDDPSLFVENALDVASLGWGPERQRRIFSTEDPERFIHCGESGADQ